MTITSLIQMTYQFRKLTIDDIGATYEIRFSVTENLIHQHQLKYLHRQHVLTDIEQGGGWMCLCNGKKIGFSMAVFALEPIIAALFVVPDHHGKGVGKKLLSLATAWFVENGALRITLETDRGSTAEGFYR